MPEIIPFKAYRYDPAKVGRLDSVLAPPYDVISDKLREELYARNPHNFVRLDLKKGSGNGVYAEAARELGEWMAKGVFRPEGRDSIYVYEQDYRDADGKPARRVGFISLMKIDPSKVKKHEHTLSGPKADRMSLTEHLRAQMSPIFGIFEDKGGKVHAELRKTIKARKAAVDVRMDGVRHRLYVEDDPVRIGTIARLLKPRPMYIADGHHRFEVASQYAAKHGQPYVLTYLCADKPNDLTIYPTHRVLSLENGWTKKLEGIIDRHFLVKRLPGLKGLLGFLEKKSPNGTVLGLGFKDTCCGGKSHFYALKTKSKKKEVDVILAAQKVIDPLLGGEEVAYSKRIRFTRDPKEAVDWLESQNADLVVFLSKLPIKEVIRVSDAGINLPQKSTYFYPKLLSGLVFFKF